MTDQPATAGPNGPNAEQRDYWNAGSAADAWTSLHADIDRQFIPLTRAAIETLAPQAGERILDIGCGCGDTTVKIAERVGPAGRVVGLDISEPMLGVAQRRAADAKLGNVGFTAADAQTYAFEPGAFDAVFSRFGVMFFADPTAAFANIRTSLRPGGRLAFLCWRKPNENPCLMAPYKAAIDLFMIQPEKADPLAPGPFAFSDAARIEAILGGAGFKSIAVAPHDVPIGGHPLERALHLALSIGPLSRLLREQPDVTPQATEAVRALMQAHDGPDGVMLASGTWLVTARA